MDKTVIKTMAIKLAALALITFAVIIGLTYAGIVLDFGDHELTSAATESTFIVDSITATIAVMIPTTFLLAYAMFWIWVFQASRQVRQYCYGYVVGFYSLVLLITAVSKAVPATGFSWTFLIYLSLLSLFAVPGAAVGGYVMNWRARR